MSADKVICTLKLIDPSGNIYDGRMELSYASAERKAGASDKRTASLAEESGVWSPYAQFKLTALLYASDITGQDSYPLEGWMYADYNYGPVICQNLQGVSGTTSATIGMNTGTNAGEGKGGVFTWYPDQTGFYVPYVMAVTEMIPA